jgi:hypothetical protein
MTGPEAVVVMVIPRSAARLGVTASLEMNASELNPLITVWKASAVTGKFCDPVKPVT